jgi:V/A-type H+-transporting ATPase subunit B
MQSRYENRKINQTIEKGWQILGLLPRGELDRVNTAYLDKYYKPMVNI